MARAYAGRLIVVCVVASASLAASAWAASGRSMAIGRAFSYAYNNPQQSVGSGPLGSSIYAGNYGGGGFGLNRPAYSSLLDSPLTSSLRTSTAYTPMAPTVLSPAGSTVNLTPPAGFGYANPVRESISVLAARDREGFALDVPPLTSLAPRTPGAYREAMLRGEAAFRQGKFDDAVRSFQAARGASNDSAESLLSLAQVYFAMGEKYYAQAAGNLAKVLAKFPGLMQVRVRPVDFFPNAQDYNKAVASLDAYVAANPKDSAAVLLLGYMQYRSGLVDKSLSTVEAGMATSPAKDMEDALAALYEGILRTGKVVAEGAPAMAKAIDYGWAGIRLAMPTGFKPSPLASPNQVISGMIDNGQGVDPEDVSLYAYPLGEGDMTLKALMDFMMNSIRSQPSIKDMNTEAEAEVPFQTGHALVRLFNYSSGESQKRTFMGWVAFVREPADKTSPRIAYLLGLATTEKRADALLPTLAAIAKTIEMSDVTSPSAATIDVQGSTIQDAQFNFAITQPWGWSGRPTDKGFEMGQMDFARGSSVSPKVDLIVQTVPAAQTPRTLVEAAIERKAPKGMTRSVISQGPAKMAGLEGYEVVGTQKPDEGTAGFASTIVCRIVCVDQPDGHRKMYALVVNCRDCGPTDAQALTDRIGATLQILKPEQPAGK